MEKVFITGADGMLGSHVVRSLLERGWHIRAFLQPGRQGRTLDGLDLERVHGDLLDLECVVKAAAGCDYIIHAAALTQVWPDRNPLVRRVNVEGTRHIIEVARRQRVKRLVFIGSASSFGASSLAEPADENTPYEGERHRNDYISSKHEAMLLVQQAYQAGLDVVTVCPTFMFGAYDAAPGSGAMILALYRGKLPGYTRGMKNYIWAKDVATGAVNALTEGRAGEVYLLGHENLSFKEVFQKIGNVINRPAPRWAIPSWMTLAYAHFDTGRARILGKAPTLSPTMARLGDMTFCYSAQKAITELALPQTPIEIGIQESFGWFRDNHYL
jgi:dihydroflavonol-4-reductase